MIFSELINRELLDYPARNAECFYASKRPVGIARIKGKLSRHNSRGTHAFLRPKEGEPFVLDAVEKRRKSLPPIFSGETVNLGRDLHSFRTVLLNSRFDSVMITEKSGEMSISD